MDSSIIFFSATPISVTQGQNLTLKVTSVKDGNVIYTLPSSAPITFAGGVKSIKKTLVNKRDTTITSLNGTSGLVVIKAHLEGEDEFLEQTIDLN